ncbi:MAG: hypothetical protein JXM70_31100, partial [Pirellulales bacterium]|nr:hypothetical protein [Pirellulales bacterium]
GSHWGALNVAFPCRLVPPEHELVTGTLRKLEDNISKGDLPLHLGWQALEPDISDVHSWGR